jgi:putative N-acetyltransferase (TIGR04045 family)
VTDVRPFRSSSPEPAVRALDTSCRPVATAGELAAHHRIRRAVFVTEQALFSADDADEHDGAPDTVHVLGFVEGAPAGTVRLYPLSGSLWHGDRLAVLPPYRRTRLGAQLVRLAVSLARERGGARMRARVQALNVPFFEYLGWAPTAPPADHLGVPHRWMATPL